MAGFVRFLRCIGRAVVKNGARALARLVPFGEAAYEIAEGAHEEYRKDRDEADLRAGLESLAQATPAEVRQAAEAVAGQEAAGQPEELRLELVSYLDQLPDSVRASLRRPADPSGTTLPADRPLGRPGDLLPFLPAVPAHTRPADGAVTVTGPRRTYTLHSLLAVGDVADVHLASAVWSRLSEPRLDADGRRTLQSASKRGSESRDHTAAEASYVLKASRLPGGQVLLDNERQALTGLLTAAGDTTYRRYLPTLTESFPAKDRFPKRVNVFLNEPGFYTLEQVHDRHPALDGKHLAWIFKRMLTVLGFSHRQGTVHGAVLPCHVLLQAAEHGLRLVGWGQSVEAGRPIEAVATRYRDWYPLEVLKKQPALPATDLFLAARCLIYLAGGDPVCDRMPDTVPEPLRRFVRSCLLEGVRMRPPDAWKLQDELDEVLGALYGPPRFYELPMS